MEMGPPILGNMIMIGALIELELLPFDYEDFSEILSATFNEEELDLNIQALHEGKRFLQ
jgi:Pyruvate/2-oxoacid:ferredoxin oxidoreductase gamma subunit